MDTIVINSDSDMPKCLNTRSKQCKVAKRLAAACLGSPATQVDTPPMQGFFSRTIFVALKDGRQVAVQFRLEDLDLATFRTARAALGPVVPEIGILESEELEEAGVRAYWMTRCPGQTWYRGVTGKGAAGRVAVCQSLGAVLSRGHVGDSSVAVVEDRILPHIDAILASDRLEISPFKKAIEDLKSRVGEIASLPLWISHFDLNEVNVLVDEECRVSGLIDWELSIPLPFGVGLGRIHTIAGEYSEGEFHVPEEFEEAERGFWSSIFSGMDASVRERLELVADTVQQAVLLGSILNCFSLENGKLIVGSVSVKALPKFLTYRIPLVRGDDPPYAG